MSTILEPPPVAPQTPPAAAPVEQPMQQDWRARRGRAAVVGGLILIALGVAALIQVRTTSGSIMLQLR